LGTFCFSRLYLPGRTKKEDGMGRRWTSQSIAEAIEAGRQPGGPLDRLANLTRETPIQSLAIAFLLGFIIARRR
jgi:hypothetical protein